MLSCRKSLLLRSDIDLHWSVIRLDQICDLRWSVIRWDLCFALIYGSALICGNLFMNSRVLQCVLVPSDWCNIYIWHVALLSHGMLINLWQSFYDLVCYCVLVPSDWSDIDIWHVALLSHGVLYIIYNTVSGTRSPQLLAKDDDNLWEISFVSIVNKFV
jgi:hypothetical protein